MQNERDLPKTITYSMQPYTYGAVVGDLEWATESERDWNSGDPTRMRHRKVVRGKVISGTETAYLLGHRSTRDIAGQTVTIYGVRDDELDRGQVVRVAM